MDIETMKAYEWALNQNFGSVAAQYAKKLALYIQSAKSATSEEVQRAIEQLKYAREQDREFDDGTFVDSLNLAITALQAYQPWVPVSERLPENCESYLVVVREEDQPNDMIHVDVASSHGKYIDDFWDTFNDWKEGQEVHITHWKPLPKPPKGETT